MRRILLLLLLIILLVGGFLVVRTVGWDTLAQRQAMLTGWVGIHPFTAALIYLAVYILTVALSLPNAAMVTVAGGMLFGTIPGCALTVLGATIGATILLVVIRSVFADTLKRHHHRIPDSVRRRLATDGFSYLLALRFLPLFPFWIVNLATAVVGIRLFVFVPATFLGIVPVSLVLSSIGSGVGTILAQGRTPDLSVIFTPHILLPLAGLAALSLLPILLRRRSRTNA